MSKAFGPEYYKRFYRDQAVHNKTLVTQLGTAVFSMCKWWGLTPHPFDVTFCHGVLQYLKDADVVRATENITKETRHVLYLEISTTLDFSTVVDTTKTDLNVRQRSGDWCRKMLNPFFVQAGVGLWVRWGRKIVLYELVGTP